MSVRSLRIVVLGMMGRCPYGGQTWLYLNWMRGLHKLGHEVWYVEDDRLWPYDPIKDTVTDDCEYATRHIAQSMRLAGLPERWAFRLVDSNTCWGLSNPELIDLYRTCDVLLNIGGAIYLRDHQLKAPYRVYVETDPVTAELRIAAGDEPTRLLLADYHHARVTYGENYGAPDCGVNLCGLSFGKTRQAIDLDLWPDAFNANSRYFTTIGNYRQEGSDVEYNGEHYRWSKHWEWEKFVDLPQRVSQPFELAVTAAPKDTAFLESHGWRVTSPLEMSLDIFGAYPAYVRGSRAEFTVAKDQNVRLRSGWFSERDACYLASGKPVVSQDTGFSNVLPTGEGLFAFTTMDQAAAAIDAINSDYPRHARAARAIAEEYFECRKLAARLLADVGLS